MIEAQTFASSWQENYLSDAEASQLPNDAVDWSWQHDVAPSVAVTKTAAEDGDEGPHVRLWIAEANPEDREYPDAPRYCVETYLDACTPAFDAYHTDTFTDAATAFERAIAYMRAHY